jgi:hypothetical protein
VYPELVLHTLTQLFLTNTRICLALVVNPARTAFRTCFIAILLILSLYRQFLQLY